MTPRLTHRAASVVLLDDLGVLGSKAVLTEDNSNEVGLLVGDLDGVDECVEALDQVGLVVPMVCIGDALGGCQAIGEG